jgi:acyl dehydratase
VPSPRPIVASAPVTREAPTAPTATRHRLQLDEVSVGDRLPDLVHELTVTDVVLGAMAARDWRPMHHDPAFARERSGVADVFLDTPTQQAWCERFLTDWTGPTGRLGRLDLRMGRPVVAGDTMTVSAEVDDLAVDATGSAWVTVVGSIAVDGAIRTRVRARLAVPAAPGDNPWARRGSDWLP